MLYFAYGSNLDEQSWATWCAARGYDPASIEPLGPAWLPDYELVFRYRSRLRAGGALDVRARRGSATPGALFRVRDWAGLDAKEGVAGDYYERIRVTVLTNDGHAHLAQTYRVHAHRLERSFVAPAPEYREMVARGLSRFGHGHEGFLAAAEDRVVPPMPNALFTYGTLMSGQARHDLIGPRARLALGPGHVAGARLIHIDWYPGMVLGGPGSVHGELFELDDVAAVLEELDAYEDFAGYEDPGSLYRRSLVEVHGSSRTTLAWTYVYLGDPEAFRAIESGRWSGA